jgi:hypothetical protein
MSVRRSYYSQEPELYSTTHSTKLGWDASMTPRKWRTIYASNAFQPSWLYRKQKYVAPNQNWIGKYFIPVDSTPAFPDKNNYVMEYDIMRQAGMYIYRILYAVKNDIQNGFYPRADDSEYVIKSKPSIEGRPGQMNIILDTNNIILDVQYW